MVKGTGFSPYVRDKNQWASAPAFYRHHVRPKGRTLQKTEFFSSLEEDTVSSNVLIEAASFAGLS
jgi:hypothetical protein